MNWIYNEEVFNTAPEGMKGFVYIVYLEDGRFYIGKKNFYQIRKRKFGKREMAKIKDKRRKNYEMVTKESNWRDYTGSNKDLNKLIKNGSKYAKKILAFAETSQALTYLETKYQFLYQVLEDDNSFNSNILGKFYSKGKESND